jgi:ABC-type transporter Mla subunit MlaD
MEWLRNRNRHDAKKTEQLAKQVEESAGTLIHVIKRMERLATAFERLAAAIAMDGTDDHGHQNSGPDILRRLDRIAEALSPISKRLEQMALDFARLESEVAENSDAVQSVITLLTSIAQEIRDTPANQAKIAALADKLDVQTKVLADAVAANTPAEPTP